MEIRKQQTFRTGAEAALILAAVWLCAGFIRLVLPNSALIVSAALSASALVLLGYYFPTGARRAADFCFRYRWLLALLVFCVCVCLRLHGSSIGVYNEVFPTQITAEETTLFGLPRWIRTDEHGVTTPKYFSQAYNDYGLYSRQMSLSPTNMVLDYYSPVWDWTVLGKPMSWGFLLFGNEIGLSWYWCMEIILLFMTALEMCLILTRGDRLTSLLGAVMVALSPEIQWWMIPQLPPAILYAMALFCVCYWFFTAKTLPSKATSALLLAGTLIGFALSVLPAVQIPALYINIALLVVCLRRDRDRLGFTIKDIPRLLLSLALAAAVLGGFVLKSADDFPRALNTVYPGKRISTGGTWTVAALFPDLTSLFLPYRDTTYVNNCEVSTFIHLAPFFFLFSPRIMLYLKQKNDRNAAVGKTLMWILAVEAFFMLAGIPETLAKITFLSYSNRMDSVYDWTAMLFTVWGFSVLLKHPDIFSSKEKIGYPFAYGIACFLFMDGRTKEYFTLALPHGGLLLLGSLMAIALLPALASFQKKRLLSTLLILLMFFCGATVNPVERGTGALTNHPVSAAMSEIAAREPESRWLCTDCTFYVSNFLLAIGAKVLDSTNSYPDAEKWAILDPLSQHEDLTNRYANESAVLTDEESWIEVTFLDQILLHLNPESLKELNIRYLFGPVDHTELLARYGIDSEYVTGQDGYGIYRLQYKA